MSKMTNVALVAVGLTLGAVGSRGISAATTPPPYATGIIVGRLPTLKSGLAASFELGKPSYATGAVNGGYPSWAQLPDGGTQLRFKDLPPKRVDFTAEDQKCLNQVMDRHAADLLKE